LAGQYTDVSRVEKYELSKEEYASRRGLPSHRVSVLTSSTCADTVLEYKQAHKVGRFASPSPRVTPDTTEIPHVDIPVGSRCEVDTGGGGPKRRGIVRFVGPTKFGKGVWIGIEYDEPMGKNDGSYVTLRYAWPDLDPRHCFMSVPGYKVKDTSQLDRSMVDSFVQIAFE